MQGITHLAGWNLKHQTGRAWTLPRTQSQSQSKFCLPWRCAHHDAPGCSPSKAADLDASVEVPVHEAILILRHPMLTL
eukprot:366511-Chlamydomonas_euryale.AAC.7